ncbi:hypothetical protein JCM8547_001505 [Rhodosporidiobolus lusitaniae]
MAPVLFLEALSPLQALSSGSSFFLRALLILPVYIILKLVFLTFVGPRLSSIRAVPGPKPKSAWTGSLGETLDLGPGVAFDKYRAEFGGAVKLQTVFGNDALIITDPAALQHVLVEKSYDYVKPKLTAASIGDLSGPGLVVLEGDSHRRQRKLMLPSFSPSHMRDLAPIITEKSQILRDQWLKLVKEGAVEASTFKTVSQCDKAQRALGKNEAILDVMNWFNSFALDVIGLAGFGHEFDNLNSQSSTLSDSWHCFANRVQQKPTPVSFLTTRLLRTVAIALRPSGLERFIPSRRIQVDRKLRMDMEEESRKIIEEKVKDVKEEGKVTMEGKKDLIALLLRANWGDAKAHLTNEELRAEMMTILLAGHETTSNALTWLAYNFAKYPQVEKKLREELVAAQAAAEEGGREEIDLNELEKLEYLEAVIREMFRFEPSIPVSSRQALQPDVIPLSIPIPSATNPSETLSSIPIKKGQQIVVPIYAANRSKELYGEDADEFRPERWIETDEKGERKIKGGSGLYGMMTFLQGPRGCIGYKFAILEMKIALSILLPTFTFSLRDPDMHVERRAEIVSRAIVDGDNLAMPLRVGLVQ